MTSMNIDYGSEVSHLNIWPIESLTLVPKRLIRGYVQGYSTKTAFCLTRVVWRQARDLSIRKSII